MRREACQYVKRQVSNYLAPTYQGRIDLLAIYRLFSDHGTLVELEACMDEFVKEGIAQKSVEQGCKYYVFANSVCKHDKARRQRIRKLKIVRFCPHCHHLFSSTELERLENTEEIECVCGSTIYLDDVTS
jgi:ribosomal protein L33